MIFPQPHCDMGVNYVHEGLILDSKCRLSQKSVFCIVPLVKFCNAHKMILMSICQRHRQFILACVIFSFVYLCAIMFTWQRDKFPFGTAKLNWTETELNCKRLKFDLF